MFVYPFVVLALVHILQNITNKYAVIALAVSVFFTPFLLSFREFQKMDMGKIKADQQEEIMILKEIIPKPGTAFIQIGDYEEHILKAQILAELPLTKPLKPIQKIREADYIILTEKGFTKLSNSKDFDILIECISEMKSHGTNNYMVFVREGISQK
jgi:hypothetical protein